MISEERLKLEEEESWSHWQYKIPFIPLPEGCQIMPLPPAGGAIARFKVKKPNGNTLSVYLDVYNCLGYMDGPYWEVYPCDGDARRCYLDEIDELAKLIDDA